ncbi:MAG: PEP/pyruvate-binding domain-containing protein [Chrysiogenia bacterium]
MPYKVKKLLLVASLYDYFMLEEDGRLHELLSKTYQQWNLGYIPHFVRVSGGENALKLIKTEKFDLIVAVMRLGDMDPFTFGRQVKEIEPELPVIGLAYFTPELKRLLEMDDGTALERIFVWQGDGHILLGIIQFIEDRKNAANDTQDLGVQNILLIEDSIDFYSSYMPLIFSVLRNLTENLLKEDLTFSQKLLRQNARPRVHLATTYEEAEMIFEKFKNNLLGIITDASFPRNKVVNPKAGINFVKKVLAAKPHLPILLQSSDAGAELMAAKAGIKFISKNSLTLLRDLSNFLSISFGFGDLVLSDARTADETRIADINQLFKALTGLPEDALAVALSRGDLDRWLRARTEFALADAVQKYLLQDAQPGATLGSDLKKIISDFRSASRRGSIVTYSRFFHEEYSQFSVIGGGSIGGKARGLAFMDRILVKYFDPGKYPGVTVSIPRTVVLGTDVFDDFIKDNDLLATAVADHSDSHMANLFIKASLPGKIVGDLRDFIKNVKVPLAVRSSSLLEDSLYQPFAGIYATKMLPNDQAGDDIRFLNLINAIKFVFASTFFRQAKSYINSTPHRIEDEKMAVVIQPVVGKLHRDSFYPEISGVARSYNYYPVGQAKPEDGVVNVALGLGKTVVDGGVSLRFTPAFAGILPQFTSVKDMFNFSQRDFYAIAMHHVASIAFLEEDQYLVKLGLDKAEADGVLQFLASTYSRENDAVYDGISFAGPRIVNFAHILKNDVFPLAKILIDLLKLSSEAMNCAVEMEFAVILDAQSGLPGQFSILQVRPLVVQDELVKVELDDQQKELAFCFSDRVLGNGILQTIRDIVFVKPDGFDAAKNPQIAVDVGKLNSRLQQAGTPYLLIGPGRWGSTDPWLGIPVKWSQISGVKVVVEASLPNMNVDPSQGSHFFQNMTSLRIGYFTVPLDRAHGFIDWTWLETLPVTAETTFLKHVCLPQPITVMIDGRRSQGVILKPTVSAP